MGELLGLLDGILDISELYAKYGVKGCGLIVLAVIGLIGLIIVLASFMQ